MISAAVKRNFKLNSKCNIEFVVILYIYECKNCTNKKIISWLSNANVKA